MRNIPLNPKAKNAALALIDAKLKAMTDKSRYNEVAAKHLNKVRNYITTTSAIPTPTTLTNIRKIRPDYKYEEVTTRFSSNRPTGPSEATLRKKAGARFIKEFKAETKAERIKTKARELAINRANKTLLKDNKKLERALYNELMKNTDVSNLGDEISMAQLHKFLGTGMKDRLNSAYFKELKNTQEAERARLKAEETSYRNNLKLVDIQNTSGSEISYDQFQRILQLGNRGDIYNQTGSIMVELQKDLDRQINKRLNKAERILLNLARETGKGKDTLTWRELQAKLQDMDKRDKALSNYHTKLSKAEQDLNDLIKEFEESIPRPDFDTFNRFYTFCQDMADETGYGFDNNLKLVLELYNNEYRDYKVENAINTVLNSYEGKSWLTRLANGIFDYESYARQCDEWLDEILEVAA